MRGQIVRGQIVRDQLVRDQFVRDQFVRGRLVRDQLVRDQFVRPVSPMETTDSVGGLDKDAALRAGKGTQLGVDVLSWDQLND